MEYNKIIEELYTSPSFRDAIKSIVSKDHRDDFLQHIIIQVMETPTDKIIELHRRAELHYFALRLILNQWRSTTSSYWKIYRNSGFPGERAIVDNLPDLVDEPEEIYNPLLDLTRKELKQKISDLLTHQHEDILQNQYHKTLFMLYHFDNIKLTDIEKLTGINYKTIHRSIVRTRQYLKENL